MRRVVNGLNSSLNLEVLEIQSRGDEDRGNLAQIQELQPSESHCENCFQWSFESVMFSEGMLDVQSNSIIWPKELWELTAMETALVTAPTYPWKNLENGAGCIGNQRVNN